MIWGESVELIDIGQVSHVEKDKDRYCYVLASTLMEISASIGDVLIADLFLYQSNTNCHLIPSTPYSYSNYDMLRTDGSFTIVHERFAF